MQRGQGGRGSTGSDAVERGGTPSDGVSPLLARVRDGDAAAHQELFAALYSHLRRAAQGAMRNEPPGQTLQPTALVHEVFLSLTRRSLPWADRRHFLAVASRAMRNVLIDHARRRRRRRRLGSSTTSGMELLLNEYDARAIDLLALEDALRELERDDQRAGKVVELRFFGGLSLPEVARTLAVPLRTVERDWQWARAYLHAKLS